MEEEEDARPSEKTKNVDKAGDNGTQGGRRKIKNRDGRWIKRVNLAKSEIDEERNTLGGRRG